MIDRSEVKDDDKHPAIGKRVEIPAYANMWMKGARYGVVDRVIVKRGQTIFRVKLDLGGNRLHGYIADDCRFID